MDHQEEKPSDVLFIDCFIVVFDLLLWSFLKFVLVIGLSVPETLVALF